MSLTFGYAIFSLSCRTSWCVRYVAVVAGLSLLQTVLGAMLMSTGTRGYLVFAPLFFQILSSWKIYLYNWPSALHMCVFMLINCLTYFYIMMSWEQELAREVDDSWISVMIWNQYGFRIDMCMNYAWNFLSYFIMCYFYLIYSGNKVILKWMCNFFLFSSLRVLSFSIRSYCMQVVTYVIPHEWYCAGCQEYANGCPKPSQSI